MARRSLSLKEKKIVAETYPNLNVENWLKYKSTKNLLVLKHKYTGTRKEVPIIS